MPNWCQNKLTVENTTESFIDFIRENGFSFNKIAPVEQVSDNEEQLANQVAAWSTKWDLDEEEQKQVAFELIENNVVHFNTAWCPPTAVIEALSEMFPSMDFRLDYFEPGCFFAGSIFAGNGISTDETIDEEDEIKEFATEVFGWEWEDDEEENDEEEEDESFQFSSDFSTDARTHSLSSYDPDDEE